MRSHKYYEGSEKGTPVMRVIPVKRTLKYDQQILDTEEGHRIIETATNLALAPCPCRVRTESLGIRECKDKFPIGFCIMLESAAAYYQAQGLGRKVSAAEAIKYFDEMQDLGLVATTENFEESSAKAVICLCCDCCCSQLRGRTRWENPDAVSPSNFVAEAGEDCVMCGTCVERCFFQAISLDDNLGRAAVDEDKCMGCGVCTISCDQEAMKLKRVERAKIFPTSRELYKKIAVENHEENKRASGAVKIHTAN